MGHVDRDQENQKDLELEDKKIIGFGPKCTGELSSGDQVNKHQVDECHYAQCHEEQDQANKNQLLLEKNYRKISRRKRSMINTNPSNARNRTMELGGPNTRKNKTGQEVQRDHKNQQQMD
ncbi:hypothetical protein NDU88_002329 [Pleurodeles waltl]|uniref:Uncharacterized protein n=1 Tax=Pleurodeles waltl TaxID=8319 RepID=A0AAV7WPV6_PLEWA|nr:hypothetical protein NDU88_002329 [Pleurodeles waltl]